MNGLINGSAVVRCRRCDTILGNLAGRYFLASFSHRNYVVRDLLRLVCDCGAEWSPLPIGARDIRGAEQIIDDTGCQRLYCPTDGCTKTLGMIGTIGEPLVAVQFHRRVILARELLFVSCDRCRASVEPPFVLPLRTVPVPLALAPNSPLEGAFIR